MKRYHILVSLFLILLSCTRNPDKPGSGGLITPRIKKQIIRIAVGYSSDKVRDSHQSVLNDGTISIGNDQLTYVINPSDIVTGFIDNDVNEDAIISLGSFKGKFHFNTEHLILLKTDGKFKLKGVLEGDMKILAIKDNLVFSEISKFPSDSPTYGCGVCKEVVRYKYNDGSLVLAQ